MCSPQQSKQQEKTKSNTVSNQILQMSTPNSSIMLDLPIRKCFGCCRRRPSPIEKKKKHTKAEPDMFLLHDKQTRTPNILRSNVNLQRRTWDRGPNIEDISAPTRTKGWEEEIRDFGGTSGWERALRWKPQIPRLCCEPPISNFHSHPSSYTSSFLKFLHFSALI